MYAEEKLQSYADDIGYEYNTLRVYRYVSGAWTPDTRVAKAPWSVYRELASHPERVSLIKDGMTVAAAKQEIKVRKEADRIVTPTLDQLETLTDSLASHEEYFTESHRKWIRKISEDLTELASSEEDAV